MKEIKEKIEKLLCELLEKSGNIILNNEEMCIEDRLGCYQEIVEEVRKIDEQIEYVTSVTENFE